MKISINKYVGTVEQGGHLFIRGMEAPGTLTVTIANGTRGEASAVALNGGKYR